MIISNCVVTQSNAQILRSYVDSVKDPLYKVYKKLCLGVEIKLPKTPQTIYSLFPGVVVHVGHVEKKYTIIIAYNSTHCVKYDNLTTAVVKLGDEVDTAQKIGTCADFLHFEYLNNNVSNWPVRIDATTLYKHDPTVLLTDGYESLIDYTQETLDPTLGYDTTDDLTEEIADMLSDNR